MYVTEGLPVQLGGADLLTEIPFCTVAESKSRLQQLLLSVLLERGTEGWYVEEELYLQAAELLHKNWPGLCDLHTNILRPAVPAFYIPAQPLQRKAVPNSSG